MPGLFLWVYNGADWVKSLCTAAGATRVARANVPITLKRMTGTGSVVTGARALYWLHIDPSGQNWDYELTDATAGGATVYFDDFHADRNGPIHTFDPPIPFSTGIYVETFTNLTSLTFAYE